jgi:predicted phosphate transport protein (TIGR00153 family)
METNMFGLIPKDEKFFAMFKEMTVTIIEGASLLKDMMDNFENPLNSQKRIKDVEHKCDQLTHDIIKKLNKSFITPFDREDIYALSSALDDIMDLIDASSQRFVMYNVEKPTPESKELAFIILKSCQTIDKAVGILGGKLEPIAEYCVEVNALENEADRVCREAISKLFDEEKDAIQLIKWKEIYETLERATDKCEDAANILESVVVKNA